MVVLFLALLLLLLDSPGPGRPLAAGYVIPGTQPLDPDDDDGTDGIVEDVRVAANRVGKFISHVQRRSRDYRDRAQKWLQFQTEQQNRFFETQLDLVGDRVAQYVYGSHTQEELLQFRAVERERAQKAKTTLSKGLHEAAVDMIRGTREAEHRLEEGLARATKDLYRGIELANARDDVKDAKRDLLRKIRRSTIDIFRGVRKSRHDYRQALYRSRKLLQSYHEQVRRDLALID